MKTSTWCKRLNLEYLGQWRVWVTSSGNGRPWCACPAPDDATLEDLRTYYGPKYGILRAETPQRLRRKMNASRGWGEL